MRANQKIIHEHRRVILNPPAWVARTYSLMALVLIPWIFYLAISLPRRHLISNYDVSWAGFDIGLLILFLLTALLAYLKSRWLVISAAASGSFLILDAWFDVLGSRHGAQTHEAILLAIFIEIPLAFISFSLAAHVLMKNIK